MNYLTCFNYTTALKFGNKYIFRTMPRTLTIWLDLGEVKATKAELKQLVATH
jgi:serine/threonine-protein kinase ATR